MYDRCFELWSSLAEAYAKKGLLSNAEACFQAALELEGNIQKKYLTIKTYTQSGLLYLEQNKMDLAQRTIEEAVRRGKKFHDDYRLVQALIGLGHCYLKQSKDLKGLKIFEEALELSKKHSFNLPMFDILLEITDICKRNNLPTYQKYVDDFQQAAIQLRKVGAG
nr:tetratricopeptide repeat protein [Paenactinomyces guangxiensis]